MRYIIPFIIFLASCGQPVVPDPSPVLLAALQGGASLTALAADDAVVSGRWEQCVAATVTSTAFSTLLESLDTPDVIPAVSVDVSPCLEANPSFTLSEESGAVARVFSIVDTVGVTVASVLAVWGVQVCEINPNFFRALEYVRTSLEVVVSEVASPTGVVEIPAFPLRGHECR